jgi:hypothetical protein
MIKSENIVTCTGLFVFAVRIRLQGNCFGSWSGTINFGISLHVSLVEVGMGVSGEAVLMLEDDAGRIIMEVSSASGPGDRLGTYLFDSAQRPGGNHSSVDIPVLLSLLPLFPTLSLIFWVSPLVLRIN